MDKSLEDLFKIREGKKKVVAGDILIAEPFVDEDYFSRSVVYITEHSSEGSLGLVLTNPANRSLADLFEELEGIDIPVFRGGPVSTECLYYLHTCGGLKRSHEIAKGIYWGGDFNQLKKLLFTGELTKKNIRFFTGYSGWSRGQLESEMKEKFWLISEMEKAKVFDISSGELWGVAMEKMGGHKKIWENCPKDPVMN